MKVYVIHHMEGQTIVGVFSGKNEALAYCARNDPGENKLFVDDFEVDSLVDGEDDEQSPSCDPAPYRRGDDY